MANTTFRYDVVTGIKLFLDNYKTANPTLLVHTFRQRPESCAEFPYAYVDLRPERIHFESGLMVRTMDAGFIVVDQMTNNQEVMARFDVLVDSLVEALAALVGRITSETIFSDVTVQDAVETQGETDFQAVRVGLPGLLKQEGRP